MGLNGYPSQRPIKSANHTPPAIHPQYLQYPRREQTYDARQYSSSPSGNNDFGLVIKRQHQQSRSIGAIGREPRLRGQTSPEFGNMASIPSMSGRPRTLFDMPPCLPRHVSEPLSSTPSARQPTTTMQYQQRQSSYNNASINPADVAVPTIPAVMASVRGGATGQGGPYPLAARPRAVSQWTREEQQDGDGQTGDPGGTSGDRNVVDAATPGKADMDDIVPLRVKIPPPQEEICMECLMRDRDLIHVKVIGDAVWSRASDVDFKELLRREWVVDAASVEGERPRRVVRWRGFSWEEQADGGEDTLPESFRGRYEGELRESKLRELATKVCHCCS
ncbi:hypothetical protein QFC22_004933 [Naganishia vaughanmartiniae]|uniref:Uncharacterized protein n=1 Tax=Naganishia vaughanmartiniae TaxID=1424756 RepID=A0ACC2WZC4_9TREE|nr:hypothetical protein QFC22_004933 [Naganishia vaughanmartiniae]